MFHSVAVFTFRDGTRPSQVDEIADALRQFAATLDGVVAYACGTDERMREGTDHFAVAAAFDSREALKVYLEHPDHADIVTRLVAPVLATKHNVQFES